MKTTEQLERDAEKILVNFSVEVKKIQTELSGVKKSLLLTAIPLVFSMGYLIFRKKRAVSVIPPLGAYLANKLLFMFVGNLFNNILKKKAVNHQS